VKENDSCDRFISVFHNDLSFATAPSTDSSCSSNPPLEESFVGCRAGAADLRPQALEGRPYGVFIVAGGANRSMIVIQRVKFFKSPTFIAAWLSYFRTLL
jgi:hypothetical protein